MDMGFNAGVLLTLEFRTREIKDYSKNDVLTRYFFIELHGTSSSFSVVYCKQYCIFEFKNFQETKFWQSLIKTFSLSQNSCPSFALGESFFFRLFQEKSQN